MFSPLSRNVRRQPQDGSGMARRGRPRAPEKPKDLAGEPKDPGDMPKVAHDKPKISRMKPDVARDKSKAAYEMPKVSRDKDKDKPKERKPKAVRDKAKDLQDKPNGQRGKSEGRISKSANRLVSSTRGPEDVSQKQLLTVLQTVHGIGCALPPAPSSTTLSHVHRLKQAVDSCALGRCRLQKPPRAEAE
jgi:hypothetical protein